MSARSCTRCPVAPASPAGAAAGWRWVDALITQKVLPCASSAMLTEAGRLRCRGGGAAAGQLQCQPAGHQRRGWMKMTSSTSITSTSGVTLMSLMGW